VCGNTTALATHEGWRDRVRENRQALLKGWLRFVDDEFRELDYGTASAG